MRVLVVPDVHLKPWMFRRASELMKETESDRAVCLMDIADDWQQQFNLDLYIQTYDAAIDFAKEYPVTLWCYGNHDVCYLWNQRETGYSKIAPWTVCEKLRILRELLPNERQLAYLHRIDNVLFSHGGLADAFVRRYVPASKYNDVDAVVSAGMFRPANITTLTRSSTRSMDSAAEKCGRMRRLSGIGRSITKGSCINLGSFCRWWGIRRSKG